MKIPLRYFIPLGFVASFAHADSPSMNAEGPLYQAWPGYNLTNKLDKDLIENYSNSLQGKSLEQLKEQSPIVNYDFLQKNKDKTLQIWKTTLNTPYDPGPQVIMEHLTRINLGLPPNQDIATSPATTKLLIKSDPRITTYANTPLSNIQSSFFTKDIPGSNQQTIGGNNIGPKFQNTDPFRNDISGVSRSIAEKDLLKLRTENKDCIGNFTSSTGNRRLTREQIYKCFVTLNTSFDKVMPKGSYLDALDLLTSITITRDGTHSCMASFYDKDTWITAAHCVSYANIADGRSILINGKQIPITKTIVKSCGKPGCDVAFISSPTNVTDTAKYELRNPNLSLLTEQSQILIAGIEEGSPILPADKSPYKSNLMWSDVGKGFCRIFRVQSGCLSHTCSTLSGFSGAPIYWVNSSSSKIELIGVHSGESVEGMKCNDTESNYAVASDLYQGALK
ncbi:MULTISPECIES: serine protease [unclassified Pseudomonas]|uniref:trypsin-like serine peptidase n=1 Tax=unclassified Pseudomonas TaxID=196821 RepID=UPI001483202C|nr:MULTISPECIES: trypsin-like serine protease [unclassified Pseudomonas]